MTTTTEAGRATVEPGRWLQPCEVSPLVGMTRTTLARYADSGIIYARRFGACGHRRYAEVTVQALIDEGPEAAAALTTLLCEAAGSPQ